MDEINPYAAPTEPLSDDGLKYAGRELRLVAILHKVAIYCILVYAAQSVIQSLIIPPNSQMTLALNIFFIVSVAFWIVYAVVAFWLSIKVFGPLLGFCFGLLSLFPCIGTFVMFGIISKASAILKDNDVYVGLLGADLSSL